MTGLVIIAGSLSALQAAMEVASQNKAKADKQKRKNPAPARSTLADLATNSQSSEPGTHDEMDYDESNDSGYVSLYHILIYIIAVLSRFSGTLHLTI